MHMENNVLRSVEWTLLMRRELGTDWETITPQHMYELLEGGARYVDALRLVRHVGPTMDFVVFRTTRLITQLGFMNLREVVSVVEHGDVDIQELLDVFLDGFDKDEVLELVEDRRTTRALHPGMTLSQEIQERKSRTEAGTHDELFASWAQHFADDELLAERRPEFVWAVTRGTGTNETAHMLADIQEAMSPA